MERTNFSLDKDHLRFQIALALQCFNNEFIYKEDEQEQAAIHLLEKQLNGLSIKKKELHQTTKSTEDNP